MSDYQIDESGECMTCVYGKKYHVSMFPAYQKAMKEKDSLEMKQHGLINFIETFLRLLKS